MSHNMVTALMWMATFQQFTVDVTLHQAMESNRKRSRRCRSTTRRPCLLWEVTKGTRNLPYEIW